MREIKFNIKMRERMKKKDIKEKFEKLEDKICDLKSDINYLLLLKCKKGNHRFYKESLCDDYIEFKRGPYIDGSRMHDLDCDELEKKLKKYIIVKECKDCGILRGLKKGNQKWEEIR